MNNKSKLTLATFIFLTACTDRSDQDINVPRVGSSLQTVTSDYHDSTDDLCPATCETDYECCPDYLTWYEESVILGASNPECYLSCCIPFAQEEDLVCRDENLTSK